MEGEMSNPPAFPNDAVKDPFDRSGMSLRDYIRFLELEVERCHHNEDLENENNLQFDKWVDEFLIANGLEKYIDPLHDYLSEKILGDGEEE